MIMQYIKKLCFLSYGKSIIMFISFIIDEIYRYIVNDGQMLKYSLITLGTAVIVDTICGWLIAFRNGGFSPEKARRTAIKVIVYTGCLVVLVPFGFMLCEMGVINNSKIIVSIMASYLAIIEIMSVMRNSMKLGVKWPAPIREILARMLQYFENEEILEVPHGRDRRVIECDQQEGDKE